jgi:predicted N-formylglutamate amidohydrolase
LIKNPRREIAGGFLLWTPGAFLIEQDGFPESVARAHGIHFRVDIDAGSRSRIIQCMLPCMPLLTADDPAAFTIERPQGRSEFLLVCDHASRLVPHSLASLGLDDTQLATHIAWDIGAANVAKRLSAALDATLLLQNYSRLVIDCNRPPGSESSIPTQSEYVRIAANEGLTTAATAARVAEIFTPYHRAISTVLEQRRVAGVRTLLVSMHSFTPVYLGETRPWKVGLMYRHDRRLGHALLELLRQDDDLHAGENLPYAIGDNTDYTIPMHGEARRLPHVGIEIRQDLITDTLGQQEWATRLASLLPLAGKGIQ